MNAKLLDCLINSQDEFDRLKVTHGFLPAEESNGQFELYSEYDEIEQIRNIKGFTDAAIKQEGKPPFKRSSKRNCSKWISKYKSCINPVGISSLVRLRKDDVHYAPEIEIFFSSANKLEKAKLGSFLTRDEKYELVNELAESIFQNSLSLSYKSKCRERKKSARRRLKSNINYCNYILERHARLLVVNIDLHYRKQFSSYVSETEVRRNREELLKFVEKTDGFLGYICKIEEGLKRGVHIHLLVLMNGYKRKSSSFLVKQWGEYWVDSVTGGAGYYFDCQSGNKKYAWRNVGVVRYNDLDSVNRLHRAVSYLTKPDQFLLVRRSIKGKQITRGKIPKFGKSKVGRPRDCDRDKEKSAASSVDCEKGDV